MTAINQDLFIPRSRFPRVPLIGFALGLLVSLLMVVHAPESSPARSIEIHTSWGFDLGDTETVMGYAHFGVVGKVLAVTKVTKETTTFAVRVLEPLKGTAPSTIQVEQIGARDGSVSYEMLEQPLLEVGRTYALALTAPADANSAVLTLLAGPVSGQEVIAESDESASLRAAAEAGRWPADLAAGGQAAHRERGREWAAEHRGYSAE